MDWKKTIGFGALLWAIMFALVSFFMAYKLYPGEGMDIILAIIAGVLSFLLAGYAKPSNINNGLALGLSWVVVGLVLDALITTKFEPALFGNWIYWLSALLILLAPTLRVKKG